MRIFEGSNRIVDGDEVSNDLIKAICAVNPTIAQKITDACMNNVIHQIARLINMIPAFAGVETVFDVNKTTYTLKLMPADTDALNLKEQALMGEFRFAKDRYQFAEEGNEYVIRELIKKNTNERP